MHLHARHALVWSFAVYALFASVRKPLSVAKSALHGSASNVTLDTAKSMDDYELLLRGQGWHPFESRSDGMLRLGTLDSIFLAASAAGTVAWSWLMARGWSPVCLLSTSLPLSGMLLACVGAVRQHTLASFALPLALCGAMSSVVAPAATAVASAHVAPHWRGTLFGLWNANASLGNLIGGNLAAAGLVLRAAEPRACLAPQGSVCTHNWTMAFVLPGVAVAVAGVVLGCWAAPGSDTHKQNPRRDQHAPLLVMFDVSSTSGPQAQLSSSSSSEADTPWRGPQSTSRISLDTWRSLATRDHDAEGLWSDDDDDDSDDRMAIIDVGLHRWEGETAKWAAVPRPTWKARMRAAHARAAVWTPRALRCRLLTREPLALWAAASVMFARFVTFAMFAWLPTILAAHGQHPSIAGATAGAFDAGGVIGAIALGAGGDKLNKPATLALASLVAGAVLLAGLAHLDASSSLAASALVSAFLGALCIGPPALLTSSVSAELGERLRPDAPAQGVSLVTALAEGAGSVGAALQGIVIGTMVKGRNAAQPQTWLPIFILLQALLAAGGLCLVPLARQELRRQRASL